MREDIGQPWINTRFSLDEDRSLEGSVVGLKADGVAAGR